MSRSFVNDRPDNRYTKIRNAMLEDPRLTLKAKGLLTLMVSRPPGWAYYETQLVTLNKDKLASLRSGMQELIDAGYVTRTRQRKDDGTLSSTTYSVTDEPEADGNSTSTYMRKTNVGETNVGKTNVGKSHTTKKDLNKTDLTKTEINKHTSETAVGPGSELAPAAPRTPSASPFLESQLLEAYNEHCGSLPRVTMLTDKRRRGIRSFVRDLPADAQPLEVFRAAVQDIAADDFWIERRYNLDNLLVNGRVIERAEKRLAATQQPQLSRGDIKLGRTAEAVARAIGGTNSD